MPAWAIVTVTIVLLERIVRGSRVREILLAPVIDCASSMRRHRHAMRAHARRLGQLGY
jgi:hypothetical protein